MCVCVMRLQHAYCQCNGDSLKMNDDDDGDDNIFALFLVNNVLPLMVREKSKRGIIS